MGTRSFSLLDANQISRLTDRQSIFLDSSIWIPLGEGRDEDAIQARDLLIELVSSGVAFCPVSLTSILELLLQEYDSAIRQAQLMEELSLNITFKRKEEICTEEIRVLLGFFLESTTEISQIRLPKPKIFAPVIAFLESNMNLEYPDEAPTDFIEVMTPKFENAIKSMGIVSLVELLKSVLPANGWKDDFDPTVFSEVWKERRIATKGSRKRATAIERQAVLDREVIPKLLEEARRLPPMQQLTTLQNLDLYISSLGMRAGEALLNALPSMNRFVEISTVAGLNDSRISSSNDFVDIENMVVPLVYADVFVARDKWVKATLSDSAIRNSNVAKCIFSIEDLVVYCESFKKQMAN